MLDQKLFHEPDAEGGESSATQGAAGEEHGIDWSQRLWRPAATMMVFALMVLVTWHAFNGKHGVQVWRQKQAEDRELRKEIDQLQQENARLRQHVDRLKSDPNAIEHEAREKLHYAKPGEVIYTLPPSAPAAAQTQPVTPVEQPTVLDVITRFIGDFFHRVMRFFRGASK